MRVKIISFLCLLAILASSFNVSNAQKGSWYKAREIEHVFDFDDSKLGNYVKNEAIELVDRGNMTIKNGKLEGHPTKVYQFGSTITIGDSYGLEDGYLAFELMQESGTVSVGIRTQKTSATINDYGIWLRIEDNKLKIEERQSGLLTEIDLNLDLSKTNKYRINDNRSRIEILINDKVYALIDYREDGYLAFLNDKEELLVSTDSSETAPTGYFNIVVNRLAGYFEEISFLHVDIDETLGEREHREIDYSNWVATDDLERVTPLGKEARSVQKDKYVGIFYFICITGAGSVVQDNTKIYLERGLDGLKEYLKTSGGEGFWAEPYFGYYKNMDTWVMRKHAYMLSAAGVDFIFIDISNEPTFNEAHTLLFDTWLQIRKEGGQTPQIMFLTGDNEKRLETHMNQLKRTVYSDENYEKYKELFFMWEGKPLIFGNSSNLSESGKEIFKDFTIRGSWAWKDVDGYWNWIMEPPQAKGRNFEGVYEQMAVTMGHHPSASKGRSYVNRIQPNNNKNDFEFTSDTARYGLTFQEQFEYALKQDPKVLMITGWNEWIAGKPTNPSYNYFANTKVDGYTYVDQFNPEFSRDGEPMKIRDGVGFGDNFYYQMVGYIRRFKGMAPIKEGENAGPINIKGNVSQWDDIGPEYRDTIGDTKFRNEPSYNRAIRYINNTGRNDFDYVKVSHDDDNLYFLVKTINDIAIADGDNWMNLYIDIDQKHSSGWEGYDFYINRTRENGKCSVEAFVDGKWEFKEVGQAKYHIDGQYMTIEIPKTLLGLKADKISIDFKWADNSTVSGDVMQFMDLGDVAPNDRFNFRYVGYHSGKAPSDNTMLIVTIVLVVIALGAIVYLVIYFILQSKKNPNMAV